MASLASHVHGGYSADEAAASSYAFDDRYPSVPPARAQPRTTETAWLTNVDNLC